MMISCWSKHVGVLLSVFNVYHFKLMFYYIVVHFLDHYTQTPNTGWVKSRYTLWYTLYILYLLLAHLVHLNETQNDHLICKCYHNHQFSRFNHKCPDKINMLNPVLPTVSQRHWKLSTLSNSTGILLLLIICWLLGCSFAIRVIEIYVKQATFLTEKP
jgi:hypothetical protein